MPRPKLTPDWLKECEALKPEESILRDTGVKRRQVRYYLSSIKGDFAMKSRGETTFLIIRKS